MPRVVTALLCCIFLVTRLGGVDLKIDPQDMPRIAAHEPVDALKTFRVKKGYHLELVAHEPLVLDPITMCFDEQGRLFVVEMIDYSERRDEKPHLGRVRMLEDTDGDGIFDQATVYAGNLPWPTALVCYDGGVFIGAAPDILWCKDNNGDGQADERKTVFTGFAEEPDRLNVQALFNSFQWGLDNRIHGTCSTTGGNLVKRVGDPMDEGLAMRRVDFSFDPRKLDLRIENGGGQYGMSFDSQGRKFMSSNSSHAQHSVYAYRYSGGNPHYAMPSARVAIAKEGGAAEVFRLSADEPWRVIRTRLRISGVVRGMVEGGGRVSGYFTGATGITVQKGDAYGPAFMDNLFVGDAGGNLVHRKIVEEHGVDLLARRPDDEQDYEFIASTDNWFRPVHFQNGPDGCLYIADMYRETIEHPRSIPPEIKTHLDLNSGNDRGRIYRIAPDGFIHPGKVDLGKLSNGQLVMLLDHPSGWQRETASRLLFTRRSAEDSLARSVRAAETALGRLHSLHLLAALGELRQAQVSRALRDGDARVREHAVALAEQFDLGSELDLLVNDRSARVRFQLALTLSLVKTPDCSGSLYRLMRSDVGDRWIRAAALNALTDNVGEVFAQLAKDREFRARSEARALLADLARIIGARNISAEMHLVFAAAAREWMSADTMRYLPALDDGLRKRGKSIMDFVEQSALGSRFNDLPRIVVGAAFDDSPRAAVIRVAAIGGYQFIGRELMEIVKGNAAPSLRMAALEALLTMPDGAVFTGIVDGWSRLDEGLRQVAIVAFLQSRTRTRQLLGLMKEGRVDSQLLDARQIQSLRSSRDNATTVLVKKIFGPEMVVNHDSIISQYKPALSTTGDAKKGQEIYALRCASCHRANGEGYQLGPDMVTVKSKGRENLLLNIINPNTEVAPQYMAFEVETKQDESYVAVIDNETATHILLRMANGVTVTLLRSDVMGMKSNGKSLMPEELYKELSVQQMADLLTFIEHSN